MKYAALCLLLLLFGCKKEPPVEPPESKTLALKAEDASCTEAWLKVSCTERPTTLRLLRDGQRVSDFQLLASDSLVVNEGLLPKHTYAYQLQKLNADSTVIETSASVHVTTMDTSSHAWTFIAETLGVTSSVLYDVAIISENNVWAVGEIFLNDSTGQLDPILYNAAHWDGTQWDIRRITWQGLPAPIRFIFAYNENDIWFGMGYLIHWDGTAFREVVVPQFYGVGSNKMWGSPDGKLYVVGNNGTIAYSPNRGATWQRVESGTRLDVYDVYGSGANVLAVAAEQFVSSNRRIMSLAPTRADSIPSTGIPYSLHGVWCTSRAYYVVGAGMYATSSLSSSTIWKALTPQVTNYYVYTIRGRARNDIIAAGAFGEVLHFNGVSWKSFRTRVAIAAGSYQGVAMNDHLCVVVGYDDPFAVIAIGRRLHCDNASNASRRRNASRDWMR
ncbi:MAG: hypothetical protein HY961_09140 [Ignavibacteriae bacterium]|nr:hypothetical protein [Ignavibacteriota bacterium]